MVKPAGSYFAGVSTCASVWACPVCAAKIRQRRAEEITGGLSAWLAAGRSALFLTVTVSHREGEALADVWDAVQRAWRRVMGGRRGMERAERWRIVGMIKALDLTHGGNGWHPHLHVVLFIDGPDLAATERAVLEADLASSWATVVSEGGRSVNGHGLHVEQVDAGDLGQYVAKVACEVTRTDRKRGRRASRSVWEVLAELAATGERKWRDLWNEYEEASKGRRAVVWSAGLRARLGLTVDLEDEDLAVDDEGGELVSQVSGPALRELWATSRVLELLDLAETDQDAARKLVAWAAFRARMVPI
jgi:hypothetical protein